MTTAHAPLLEVEDLQVRFDTREGPILAVSSVDFRVYPGETLAIVGESGCGKTCCALALLGLIPFPPGRVTAGRIRFRDIELLDLPEREMRAVRGKRIAMIFQDPLSSLNPLLSVGAQIAEVLATHFGTGRSAGRSKSIELLRLVGIPEPEQRFDALPHQLSGGMRQRVMIAMCLAGEPELLIADEPTTALDVTVQAQIVDLVKGLRDRHSISIVWITHDLGVVAGLADRVMVMYAGRIVEEASVEALFAAPLHPYTAGLLRSVPRIDEEPADELAAIGGLPPHPARLPPGCAFEPRCSWATDRCRRERPSLADQNEGHRVACWNVAAARESASTGGSDP